MYKLIIGCSSNRLFENKLMIVGKEKFLFLLMSVCGYNIAFGEING